MSDFPISGWDVGGPAEGSCGRATRVTRTLPNSCSPPLPETHSESCGSEIVHKLPDKLSTTCSGSGDRPKFGHSLPIWACFGPMWPTLANILPKLPKLGRFGPNLGRVGRMWAGICPTRPNFGRTRPSLANLGHFRRNPPTLANMSQPTLVEFGQALAQLGQIWPQSTDVGEMLAKVGPKQPTFVEFRQSLVDIVRTMAHTSGSIGRSWAKSALLAQLLGKNWAASELAGFKQLFGNFWVALPVRPPFW